MKPRALDLFCGAGGVSKGLADAGFDVWGVDIRPQPRYVHPGRFVQADALAPPFDPATFDFIWASPPCQAYSAANNIWGRDDHPRLIEPVRQMLAASGAVTCIENVPGAPLIDPVTLCGLAFGLNVKRHRLFECNFFLMAPPCGDHRADYVIVFGESGRARAKQTGRTVGGGPILRRTHVPLSITRAAMGIDWMSGAELCQAIPPAYAEFIGRAAMPHILGRKAAAA